MQIATKRTTDNNAQYTEDSFTGIRDGPTLGCGTFGRVRLVRDKETHKVYAAKCLKKFVVDDLGQREHTLIERTCLTEVCEQPPCIDSHQFTHNSQLVDNGIARP